MKISAPTLEGQFAVDFFRKLIKIVPPHWDDLLDRTEVILSSSVNQAKETIRNHSAEGQQFIDAYTDKELTKPLFNSVASIFYESSATQIHHQIFLLLEEEVLKSQTELIRKGTLLLEEIAEGILALRPEVTNLINDLDSQSRESEDERVRMFKMCFITICTKNQGPQKISARVWRIAQELDGEIKRRADGERYFSC